MKLRYSDAPVNRGFLYTLNTPVKLLLFSLSVLALFCGLKYIFRADGTFRDVAIMASEAVNDDSGGDGIYETYEAPDGSPDAGKHSGKAYV